MFQLSQSNRKWFSQEVDSDPVKEHHNWDIEDECLKRAEEVSPDELFRIYQQMFLAEKSTLNMTLGQNQEYHMEFACSTTPLKLNRVQSQQLIGRTRSSPLTGFGRANRRRLPLCSSPLSPGVSKPLEFLGAKSMFFQADLLLDTPDSTADSTLGPSPLSVTRTPRSSPLSSPSDPQSSIAAMSLSASPSEVRADPPPSCFVINNNKHKQLDEVIEENSNQNVRQSPSIPVCLRDPFDLEVLALLPASWSLIGSQ